MPISSQILSPSEAQSLLEILKFADKEIENGDTIPIEEIMTEFGVEANRTEIAHNFRHSI